MFMEKTNFVLLFLKSCIRCISFFCGSFVINGQTLLEMIVQMWCAVNDSSNVVCSMFRSIGSAVAYWIEPVTHDQRVVGSNRDNAKHYCPSARQFIHIAALDPGV